MLPASAKPYLLRALYEWCIEEGYTPHVVVQVMSIAMSQWPMFAMVASP